MDWNPAALLANPKTIWWKGRAGNENILGMHEAIPITGHLLQKALGDVWEFVGDYRLYFGIPIIAWLVVYIRSKEPTMRARILYAFIDAVAAGAIFFAIVFAWKSVVVFGEFWNPSIVLPGLPPPAPPQPEHSQTDAESKKFADLEAQINAYQLSGVPNERLDEMIKLAIRSLGESVGDWGEQWFQISIGAEDTIHHRNLSGDGMSREEEAKTRGLAKKKQASLDAEKCKELQPLLKPVLALVTEIYERRLDYKQKMNLQSEYKEIERTLKKNLDPTKSPLGELTHLNAELSDFEHALNDSFTQ